MLFCNFAHAACGAGGMSAGGPAPVADAAGAQGHKPRAACTKTRKGQGSHSRKTAWRSHFSALACATGASEGQAKGNNGKKKKRTIHAHTYAHAHMRACENTRPVSAAPAPRGGPVWFCGGLCVAALRFMLPAQALSVAACAVFALTVAVPAVYSYILYKKAHANSRGS